MTYFPRLKIYVNKTIYPLIYLIKPEKKILLFKHMMLMVPCRALSNNFLKNSVYLVLCIKSDSITTANCLT